MPTHSITFNSISWTWTYRARYSQVFSRPDPFLHLYIHCIHPYIFSSSFCDLSGQVVEDIEYLKFDKGPWLEENDVSYHHMRTL